ncbi:MAG: hypothetical protein ACD_28C00112G0002 [uncultured bacterium]|nr:MAG: hypothetical protein ACD_28C00112G0002 [uncultured bacterium]KKT74345.1 MAG: hypothetical protein UW70_C0058G0003 [Candidatus Peregrinibacteria bacterium GW2011_GWA2_44_7]
MLDLMEIMMWLGVFVSLGSLGWAIAGVFYCVHLLFPFLLSKGNEKSYSKILSFNPIHLMNTDMPDEAAKKAAEEALEVASKEADKKEEACASEACAKEEAK